MKKFLAVVLALVFMASFSGALLAADCPYLASKGGEKYHKADCGTAKNIKEENKVCFNYPEDAKTAGYSACGVCKPAECTAVVASKDSDKYHLPGCGTAKNIKKENLVEYACASEAAKAGKTPCGVCKPPKVEAPKEEIKK
jgi:methylphosphotriester-DNA--protein-cysteine methyltransferase